MTNDYAGEILAGSVRATARLISWLEDEDQRALEHMERLYPHTGRAYVIGITGSPGAGKSTLTDKLSYAIRRQGLTIGIIAVDPSSPFTGGAVLGDRVRMTRLGVDPGVYIRSMATRGFLGGLARATSDVVKVLDAFGKDIIIIETVGVGQDEVDIIRLADTTCLVLVPGLGDTIQSMKAGVMEIADLFVINKADRVGADQLLSEVALRIQQDSQIKNKPWTPELVKTVAVEDQGVNDLWDAIRRHRTFLESDGRLLEKRRERTRNETLQMIHNELFRRIRGRLAENGELDRLVDQILAAKTDPYAVMRGVIGDWLHTP
ncbi:MAG: GTPase [Syntrophobacteraceae bacterium CG2_30_61_12]|nr:MAG: GTPase [Syntrophobacteraceae bacterium CG2_30_61_12]PIU32254.1 MAG: methylmalonyl Co-A mutase-associated GTPase MeaB [Syntrophobacteraceae bacterium CG07_land_8_20_14_0_80_61_8]